MRAQRILDIFKDVHSDPSLGKFAAWPVPPAVLRGFLEKLQRIHRSWRARFMIMRLDERRREELRLKCFAHACFSGRKRRWGFQRVWEGNYLSQQVCAAVDGKWNSECE